MAGTPAPEQEIREVERETRGLTSYVVLTESSREDIDVTRFGSWDIVGIYDGTHAEAAIKKAAQGGVNGKFVAVPARSWKPMRVQQVQTVQTVIEAVET